jgi:phospholipid transport system transporter-binding protein
VTAVNGLVAAGPGAADGLRVEGTITIDLAPSVLADSAPALAAAGSGEISIDLAGLTDFDSAALGVMFEWERTAAKTGAQIRYTNLPAKLHTLASLYGVETLLVPAR